MRHRTMNLVRGLARCATAAFVLLDLGCALHSTPEVLRPNDRHLKFDTKGVLIGHANGVRVMVSPDSTTNLVEIDLRIAAGSRDEHPFQAGLAHLVEHIVFELEPDGGPTIKQTLASWALAYNATTDHDVTHIQTTAPVPSLRRIMSLYADILRGDCGSLSPEVFAREREVVRHELVLREGSDDATTVTAALYPKGHPYHHGIAGKKATLDRLTPADACDFYQRRYTPGNATLVISGAVDPQQVQTLSNELLRPLPPRPAPERPPVSAWQGDGQRRVVTAEGVKPVIALALAFPPRFHGDELAARHLMVALAGKLAALGAEEREIARTRVELVGGREAPILLAQIETSRQGFLQRFEPLLWRAVEETRELATNPVAHQITSQVLRFQTIRAVEPLARRGAMYADYLAGPEGYGFFAGDVARIDGLGVHEVAAAAERLFDRSRALTLEIIPGTRPALERQLAFDGLPEDHRSFRATHLDGPSLKLPESAPVERYTLSNGLSVILAPLAGMPVADVRLVIRAGQHDAPPEQPFLADLAARLLTPGAWNAGEDAVKMALAGASIDITVDHATTTFSTSGLGIYVDYLLEGLSAGVVRAEHHPDSLRNLRRNIRRAIQDDRPDPGGARSARRYFRALFGAECSELRDLDELVSTPSSTRDMSRFKHDFYRAANATLIVTGKFDQALAKNHIEVNFGRSGGPREYRAWNHPPMDRSADSLAEQGDRIPDGVIIDADDSHAQLALAIGFGLTQDVRRDEAVVMLLRELVDAEVLSVRERLGASYGLRTAVVEKCGRTALVITGALDPARAEQAFEELRRGFQRLRDPQQLSASFPRARAKVLRTLHAEWGDSQAIADRLEREVRRGLRGDTRVSLARRAAELELAEVSALLGKVLQRSLLWCNGSLERVQRVCPTDASF